MTPSREHLTLAVDAAMQEMKNITPPLRRSECERLISAALQAQSAPEPVQGEAVVTIELVENLKYGGMHIRQWHNPGQLGAGWHQLYTAAAKPDAEPLLAKPAKVGPGTFAAGLPARMVIEAAYRQYEYAQEPPFSPEKIKALTDHIPEATKMVDAELVALLKDCRRYAEMAFPDGVHSYRNNSISGDVVARIDAKLAELRK